MPTVQQINEAKQKAQQAFFQQRVVKLSTHFYPETAYHPEFKQLFHRLLKFNSAKGMGLLEPSWKNMCTFEREFFLVEMEVCLKVLECATPKELVNPFDEEGAAKTDEQILAEYNDVEFPKVAAIIKEMRDVWYGIDKQLSEPIARKLNTDYKLKFQLPIGTDISFVMMPTHG